MKLADVKYSQILENTESKEFKNLAKKLQETVSFDMPPFFCAFFSVIFRVAVACFEENGGPFCH